MNTIAENQLDGAVERLRASKEAYFADVIASAREMGRKWAKTEADYIDLRRLAEASDDGSLRTATAKVFAEDLADALGCAADETPVWGAIAEGEAAEAWLSGALEVWEAVSAKL
jgi:hypothetical protein